MANTSALQNVDWALESPHDYLLKLTKKCDSIDLEIIDFLVKWEDGEENDTNSNHHHHHNGGISSYQLRNIGVDAIDNVDKELKTVDDWIGEQILKLDTTKARLKVIEIESNALETCFTNLANTKEIITFIQQKLSIKESEEKLLKDPNAIFENILQASIPTKIMKREIGKLVDAISNLQYSLKYFDSPSEAYAGIAQLASNTIEANAVTLEQIRSLTFVTQQTTVLGKLCQKLCKRLAELLPSFFDDLFRHQFLTDYFLNGQTMKVRNFDLVTYSQSIMKLKKQPIDIDFANMISTNLASEMLFQLKFAFRAHDFVQFDVSTMKSVQANDGLSSQRVFHDLINSLLPILKKFQDLDRQSYQNTFIKYYVESSQTRIYKPILKAIFRKLKEKLASKATVCNFQSVSHYSLKNSSSLPLVLVPSSHQGISPWIAFGAALSIVIPLIQNEREVLSKVLFTKNIDKFGVADQDADSSEDESLDQGNEETQSDPNVDEEQQVIRLDKCCDTVFEYVTGENLKILKVVLTNLTSLASISTVEIDGMVYIAIAVVIEYFLLQSFPDEEMEASDSLNQESSPVANFQSDQYIFDVISSYKMSIEQTIDRFADEQVAWIQAQKGDPKRGVGIPVLKLPSILHQVLVLIGNLRIDSAEAFMLRIVDEIIKWINVLAEQNMKYSDLVKIQNFSFLQSALVTLNISLYFNQHIEVMESILVETNANYIVWMVEYEFPTLASISRRLNNISNGINVEADIALYVKRKDVQDVQAEMGIQAKKFEEGLASSYTRLQKHFSDNQELDLRPYFWKKILENLEMTIHKIELASQYFQIKSDKDWINIGLKRLTEQLSKL